LQDAIEAVAREGVEVFAAPYSAYATTWISKPEDLPPPSAPNYFDVFKELFRLARTNDVQALAQATGGSEIPVSAGARRGEGCGESGVEVHSQYILSFSPLTVKKGMHQIEVSIRGAPI